MPTPRLLPTCLLLGALTCLACAGDGGPSAEAAPELGTLSLAALEDKVRGGWAGQMIGVSYGAPTEFRYLARTIPEEELPEWRPENVAGSIRQDDLYVDMTFMAVLEEHGWDATTEQFGAAFRDSQYPLWHANYAARRALRRGVPATDSGSLAVNPHVNDIDFQIEADFIGLLTPGMPQAAVELAQRVGRVMNGGDGLLGGVFVGGLYSAAFFEDDPRRIVEQGLALLPDESWYAQIIRDTLQWSEENPDDWLATWQLLEDEYASGEVCPQGAGVPFNIDAHLNGAYIALGLLYGDGDFEKTMKISTQAGQDSDCNPASAAGVLGVVLGYEAIPEAYRDGIPAIADETFSYTTHSFESIVRSTIDTAVEVAERNGGEVTGEEIGFPLQEPVIAEVELAHDYGTVRERINVSDPRVVRRGEWAVDSRQFGSFAWTFATSETADSTARLDFEGRGIIVTAVHTPEGGQVEVLLDGESQGVWDTFSEEQAGLPLSSKLDEAIWHRFGLEPGEHTVELRIVGEPYSRDGVVSGGAGVAVQDFIVFE